MPSASFKSTKHSDAAGRVSRVSIQKRRGDLGVVVGLTAAELRFEPSKVKSDEVGHADMDYFEAVA